MTAQPLVAIVDGVDVPSQSEGRDELREEVVGQLSLDGHELKGGHDGCSSCLSRGGCQRGQHCIGGLAHQEHQGGLGLEVAFGAYSADAVRPSQASGSTGAQVTERPDDLVLDGDLRALESWPLVRPAAEGAGGLSAVSRIRVALVYTER